MTQYIFIIMGMCISVRMISFTIYLNYIILMTITLSLIWDIIKYRNVYVIIVDMEI
jgi:hypothetical protein